MKTVAKTLGIARSNLLDRFRAQGTRGHQRLRRADDLTLSALLRRPKPNQVVREPRPD